MECKSDRNCKGNQPDLRINRYIMECKYFKTYHFWLSDCKELIDTLWNANNFANVALDIPTSELIDTLWNVNQHDWIWGGGAKRWINRYIMECKR